MNEIKKKISDYLNELISEEDLKEELLSKNYIGDFCFPARKIKIIFNIIKDEVGEKVNNILNYVIQKQDEEYANLRNMFCKIKSIDDFAILLNFPISEVELFCKIDYNPVYKIFNIPKKSNGFRKISQPCKKLLFLQKRLNFLLTLFYIPNSSAHGFIWEKSIITNASVHLKKLIVLNIDIKNFFQSINSERVKNIFHREPFNLLEEISSLIVKMCCYENSLPQGAPTSPLLSNFICRDLDNLLFKFAQNNFCEYSRYADDITFSSNINDFNNDFVENVTGILNTQHFAINSKKIRISRNKGCQKVTGIKVNEKLNISRRYIRRIRAILNNLETKGIEFSLNEFSKKYRNFKKNGIPEFWDSILGRINYVGQVRGANDIIYQNFLLKYKILRKNYDKKNDLPNFAL